MAGFSTGDSDDIIAAINVTPLVDIILVLLIIFMVTSATIIRSAIPVDLPRASTGESQPPSTLSFVLYADGTLLFENNSVDPEKLHWALVAAYNADNEVQALITADGAVPHGEVVKLIDMIRNAGIKRFAINTLPNSEPDE